MESSAERALEIGVNLIVFIIALTCTLLLMTNVLNMSEYANRIIKDTTGSTLMELYGGTNERIYKGEEILKIITEYNSETNSINDRVTLKIDKGLAVGAEELTEEYSFLYEDLKSSYNIIYDGIDNITKKEIYIFTKI